MKVHIEEPQLVEWLGENLPLAQTDIKDITHDCPHCGCAVRYPLVARRTDIESFKYLLALAAKYLYDSGAQINMLNSIRSQILEALHRRNKE